MAMTLGVLPDWRPAITPSLPDITSLSFFKQFDCMFPVFTILSDFQPVYYLSRSHDTGYVRPLNRGIHKGQWGEVRKGAALIGGCWPPQAEGPRDPIPLRPKTGFGTLQKTSKFTPGEAPGAS